ncbi:MAG: PLP-dependent aspartate aminotransferase family protein [Thermoguttaceae bacterium]|nr:PLP-dependent aspartate aminotransferase family protein [Thermoguttaceae bacterium]MDW8080185.1 PLP-dependent aspartate aminotransferase family protein [Thermoguttaceae bacterium]
MSGSESSGNTRKPHLDRGGRWGFSTLAVHAGEAHLKPEFAITDPIFCTATYTFADSQAVLEYLQNRHTREEYGRYGNPSEKVVEQKLAELEGGETAVLFSSGMAAVAAYVLSKVRAGDEIVLVDECYHRTRQFCCEYLGRLGVVTRQVPAGNYEAMEAAITPRTRLLISESPTNPHLSVIDLERFAALGRKYGVETMIDSTIATPYNVRPLEYGVDVVLHSCTKYLGGHNDLLAGVLIGSAEKLEPCRKIRGVIGLVASPHTVYLLERGLKTLQLRMERHNQNGLALAQFLEAHPRVEKVYYPGLPSHRDYAVAKRTMRGFGGLVTFLVKNADWRETARIVDRVRIPRIGPSFGGVESLIEQPMLMSYHDYDREQRTAVGIPDNMIRVACGIEDTADLIEDFRQALEA